MTATKLPVFIILTGPFLSSAAHSLGYRLWNDAKNKTSSPDKGEGYRDDGDFGMYHLDNGRLIIVDGKTDLPENYYKPDPTIHGYDSNEDYFNSNFPNEYPY